MTPAYIDTLVSYHGITLHWYDQIPDSTDFVLYPIVNVLTYDADTVLIEYADGDQRFTTNANVKDIHFANIGTVFMMDRDDPYAGQVGMLVDYLHVKDGPYVVKFPESETVRFYNKSQFRFCESYE